MLSEFAFQSKRIPGSVNVSNLEQAKRLLNLRDEIVVYCSDPNCYASIVGYRKLSEAGFTKVRRFAGGLLEWEAAGYPLDGDDVDRS